MTLLFESAKECEKFGARFHSKVDRTGGPDACWTWMAGAKNEHGYGGFSMRVDGRWRSEYAHRIAYAERFGPIPEGLDVLHSCDNPPCCNPAHLSAGTAEENARQMHARGRANKPCGEASHFAALDEDRVRAIWGEVDGGAGVRATARKYGVTHTAVKAIAHGWTWKHLGLGAAAIRSNRGSNVANSKLTEADVAQIKRELGNGVAQNALARRYGVDQALVWRIAHGRSWAHVQPQPVAN